jgi:hypothetical protein
MPHGGDGETIKKIEFETVVLCHSIDHPASAFGDWDAENQNAMIGVHARRAFLIFLTHGASVTPTLTNRPSTANTTGTSRRGSKGLNGASPA